MPDIVHLPVVAFAEGPPAPAGERNTYGLPTGNPIAAALRHYFGKQLDDILGRLRKSKTIAPVPPDLSVTDWTDEMAAAMTPILTTYWDEAGKRFLTDVGLDPAAWRVTNPELRGRIEGQAFAFCESTNASTTFRLEAAHAALRESLAEGLIERGETLDWLSGRVRTIYGGLTKQHARLIAATEASRAVHSAQLTAAEGSGVVAGFEVLISADACNLCRKIAAEAPRVRLGDDFAVIGSHPIYSNIKHPPFHPMCMCTVVSVLLPEYGGPGDPRWAEPLDQPQRDLTDDYEPPPGVDVPEPEPGREQPVVNRDA